MKALDPLQYLARPDKWYVGGGDRLIWTPLFPVWLNHPGFWDPAHYYNVEFGPLFSWALVDESGDEIPVRQVSRDWNPARLRARFRSNGPLSVVEEKCCPAGDMLAAALTIRNSSARKISACLIVWSSQPSYPSQNLDTVSDVHTDETGIFWDRTVVRPGKPNTVLHCGLTASPRMNSYSINLSEGKVSGPIYRLTPFREKVRGGRFGNDFKLSGVSDDGIVHMALCIPIHIGARSQAEATIAFTAGTGARSSSVITLGREVGAIVSPAPMAHPVKNSAKAWSQTFDDVPFFECSDEFLTRYYWYRWYGLELMTLRGGDRNYPGPTVCEGIGYFRAPISYSAPCHMIENRWRSTPELAQGSLRTFIANQRDDGGFRGYIDPDFYRQEMFYHAHWGKALRDLHMVHPDREFLKFAYDGLARYVDYFDRERDAERSGLYDIDNHYETGQEYMHRYIAVDPDADKDNWGEVFRLKGIDVSVYLYELKKTLAWAGQVLEKPERERRLYADGALRIREAILGRMWDPRAGMFFDVDPANDKRTGVKASVCFYPYMTDITGPEHRRGLEEHLFNPKEFWTRFPVPSSSVDDEYFSPDAEWKGKRMNCPWNGRVWPMTNSHIAEAIAQSALRFRDNKLRLRAAEFITSFVRMMFYDGDPSRPNCFEHYNPFNGKASEYRGVDDYQHSWVADLIIQYCAGLRPGAQVLVVDPFPFGMQWFNLENAHVQGHAVTVEGRGRSFTVWIDGRRAGHSPNGEPVVLRWNEK